MPPKPPLRPHPFLPIPSTPSTSSTKLPRTTPSTYNPTYQRSHTRHFSTTRPQNATEIHRPYRPYTFTQVITLSDGSTYTHRTTSPQPVYRSTKDTRNTPMWNPSNRRMANIEEDSTGRLRAFRARFGRGFDAGRIDDFSSSSSSSSSSSPSKPSRGLPTTTAEHETTSEEADTRTTVIDGTGARVDPDATVGGKGVARPSPRSKSPSTDTSSPTDISTSPSTDETPAQTAKNSSKEAYREWTDADEDNLMDLIGSFGSNKAAGGAQSGSHFGGQVGMGSGGKPKKR